MNFALVDFLCDDFCWDCHIFLVPCAISATFWCICGCGFLLNCDDCKVIISYSVTRTHAETCRKCIHMKGSKWPVALCEQLLPIGTCYGKTGPPNWSKWHRMATKMETEFQEKHSKHMGVSKKHIINFPKNCGCIIMFSHANHSNLQLGQVAERPRATHAGSLWHRMWASTKWRWFLGDLGDVADPWWSNIQKPVGH